MRMMTKAVAWKNQMYYLWWCADMYRTIRIKDCE